MRNLTCFIVMLCLIGCGDAPVNSKLEMTDPATTQTSDEPATPDENENAGSVTLTAADDVKVFGTLSTAKEDNDRIILLFHQARSNRREYDPIAPQLNELGFDTLAIDQRSGGTMWEQDNETVKEIGESTEYLYALPDLQAAVDWAVEKKYKTIVTVGSSYSAALSFILAKANADKLTAIASFSPGEYLGKPDLVKDAAAEVKLPVYVTAGADDEEQSRVDDVLSRTDSEKIVRYKPTAGVHGASTLREDKNPDGAAANFAEFRAFLEEHAN